MGISSATGYRCHDARVAARLSQAALHAGLRGALHRCPIDARLDENLPPPRGSRSRQPAAERVVHSRLQPPQSSRYALTADSNPAEKDSPHVPRRGRRLFFFEHRIQLDAEVQDPGGIELVRCYFRATGEAGFPSQPARTRRAHTITHGSSTAVARAARALPEMMTQRELCTAARYRGRAAASKAGQSSSNRGAPPSSEAMRSKECTFQPCSSRACSAARLMPPSEGQHPAGLWPKYCSKVYSPSRMCQSTRSLPPG